MAPFEQNPAVLSHLTKRKRLIPQCWFMHLHKGVIDFKNKMRREKEPRKVVWREKRSVKLKKFDSIIEWKNIDYKKKKEWRNIDN
jgi:hypothetical protein